MQDFTEKALEHCRSLYFSLVAACIVLLISIFTISSGKVARAIEDARRIIELSHAIENNEEILHALAKKRYDEAVSDRISTAPRTEIRSEVLFETHDKLGKINVRILPPKFVLSEISHYPFAKKPQYKYWNVDSEDSVLLRPPRTLGEFRAFWNEYFKSRRIYYFPMNRGTTSISPNLEIEAYLFTMNKPDGDTFAKLPAFYDDPIKKRLTIIDFPRSMQRLTSTHKERPRTEIEPQFDLLLRHISADDAVEISDTDGTKREVTPSQRSFFAILRANPHWELMQGFSQDQIDELKIQLKRQNPLSHPTEEEWARAAFLGQEAGDILIEATLPTQEIPVQYQVLFAQHVNADWMVGRFEHSFPEIQEIYGTNVDSLPLENVLSILEEEKARSGGSIQIFGLQIPNELIFKWGTMALVLFQCYFSLHLRNLYRRHAVQSAAGFPWVGVFPDMVSRLAFLMTAVGLPLLVAILSAKEERTLLSLATVSVSLLAGAAITWMHYKALTDANVRAG